jgi:hypothetical protein
MTFAPVDAMRNGNGFIGVQLDGMTVSENSSTSPIRPRVNVVLNWFEELTTLVPTGEL